MCMYAGVGEPPLCMSCSALFAIKRAIENFRAEIKADTVFILGNKVGGTCVCVCISAADGPATVEETQLKCLVEPSEFNF